MRVLALEEPRTSKDLQSCQSSGCLCHSNAHLSRTLRPGWCLALVEPQSAFGHFGTTEDFQMTHFQCTRFQVNYIEQPYQVELPDLHKSGRASARIGFLTWNYLSWTETLAYLRSCLLAWWLPEAGQSSSWPPRQNKKDLEWLVFTQPPVPLVLHFPFLFGSIIVHCFKRTTRQLATLEAASMNHESLKSHFDICADLVSKRSNQGSALCISSSALTLLPSRSLRSLRLRPVRAHWTQCRCLAVREPQHWLLGGSGDVFNLS
jgi:hypothetical protein